MALSTSTVQWISQLGCMRLVDPSTGPEGPHGVTSHWLVPAGGWHNGNRFPHAIEEELKAAKLEKTTQEGVEYYLVEEVSSNLPGRLSHYAQLTGVADLANPPGGGVNRARETLENTSEATVAPEAVAKYVDNNDSYEEARKKATEDEELVNRAVDSSTPAREPAEGKLVSSEVQEEEQPAKKAVVKEENK